MSSHNDRADQSRHTGTTQTSQHGYNKTFLLGDVGRSPELRRTPRGIAAGSFSLAIPEPATTGATGADETFLVEVVMFGALAEEYCVLLTAGASVFVEGTLSRRRWQSAGGVMKSRLEIVAQSIRILG